MKKFFHSALLVLFAATACSPCFRRCARKVIPSRSCARIAAGAGTLLAAQGVDRLMKSSSYDISTLLTETPAFECDLVSETMVALGGLAAILGLSMEAAYSLVQAYRNGNEDIRKQIEIWLYLRNVTAHFLNVVKAFPVA